MAGLVSRGDCSYFRFVALIYKGKRVLMHETNLNDTESTLLPGRMKKTVCVFMLVENGIALWLVSYISVVFLSLGLSTSTFFHRI